MNAKTNKSPKAQPAPCLCQEMGPLLTDLLRRIGPPEPARRHFEAARLEFLMGLRAVVDARIEQVSKPRGGGKGQKISVG